MPSRWPEADCQEGEGRGRGSRSASPSVRVLPAPCARGDTVVSRQGRLSRGAPPLLSLLPVSLSRAKILFLLQLLADHVPGVGLVASECGSHPRGSGVRDARAPVSLLALLL